MIFKKLTSRITVVSFIVLLVFVYSFWRLLSQEYYIYRVGQQIEVTKDDLEAAQAKNKDLLQEKANLDKPEYIEKVAREELGMTKPGEIPYIPSKK